MEWDICTWFFWSAHTNLAADDEGGGEPVRRGGSATEKNGVKASSLRVPPPLTAVAV